MKTQVILSSTRDGRVSERIAKWVVESAKQHSDLGEIELVDLKDFDLPFMNESTSPKYNPNRNLTGDVKRFLDTLDQADAFIFVSPEYNRSMPGVLKNALDYVGWELNRKPAATVTHGGAGGYGASENIRTVLRAHGAANLSESVLLASVTAVLDEAGTLTDEEAERPYGAKTTLKMTLDSLAWWAITLKAGRDRS